ncbi:putative geminivirus AL1 replication-associated protein, CLV type [Helianthus annuus]|nr:putative geminivirus AL1 replication-associated protein, CLV type [Helianthus annuus]
MKFKILPQISKHPAHKFHFKTPISDPISPQQSSSTLSVYSVPMASDETNGSSKRGRKDLSNVAYKLSKSRTTNESYTEAINSDSKQSALQIMKDEQPRYSLFNFQKLDAQLDTVFQPAQAPWVSPYAVSSFTNVPQVMQKWADDYFSSDKASRPLIKPQSIIIEGGSRTGKTMWARSLGRHNYLSGYLDLNPTVFSNDVEYNVIDNVNPQCLKHWKELLGAQRDWQAKCKYRKPVQIKGGIPAIVLCNPGVGSSYMEYLNKSRNEELKSWTLQYATFIVLQEPLFST